MIEAAEVAVEPGAIGEVRLQPDPSCARHSGNHASVGESVIRGVLALLSTQPVTWAASLLTATFVPRLLGAYALGQFTTANAIATLAGVLFSLGISDYLVRRIAQNPQSIRQDLGLALLLQTATAALGGLVIAGIAPLFQSAAVDLPLLYIALLGLVFAPIQNNLLSYFRGREKHVAFAWANAAQVSLAAVGGVLILFAGAGVHAYALVSVALSAAFGLLTWRFAGFKPSLPPIGPVLLDHARQFVRAGFPFLTWGATLCIYGMCDRILLGFFVSPSEIGWYMAAVRIVGVAIFVPNLINAPLFPALSRSAGNWDVTRRAMHQTVRMSVLLTVPLTAGIIALAEAIPGVLGWPADFANAVPSMMILSLHIPFVAVDMVLGSVIMAIGRESRWVRVGLVATVFNVAVNLMGIPLAEHLAGNGGIGASVVTLLTEIVMFAGALVVLPRRSLDVSLAWQVLRIVLAGVGTAAAAMLVLHWGVIFAVAAGAAAYPLGLIALRAVQMEDVQYVAGRFGSRSPFSRSSAGGK